MKNIDIYTTNNCPYCVRAKDLFSSKKLAFNELDVTTDSDLMLEMIARSKRRSVPQIFIDGASIGGYDELASLNRTGELEQYLNNVQD